MIKRILAAFMALLVALQLCSCVSGVANSSSAPVSRTEDVQPAESSAPDTSKAPESTAPESSVQESSAQESSAAESSAQAEELVPLVLPRDFFTDGEEMTDEDLQQMIAMQGYECTINPDGTVTWMLPKPELDAFLQDFKDELDASILEMTQGEDAAGGIIKVEYNDDLTEFDMTIDQEKFGFAESMYQMAFYLYGAYYQMFSGVPEDDIDILIRKIDQATGEVIETNTYKEFMENNNVTPRDDSAYIQDETVLADNQDFKMTLNGVTWDDFMGTEFHITCENLTDQVLLFSSFMCSIQGYLVPVPITFTVEAHESIDTSFYVYDVYLDQIGLDYIDQISLELEVCSAENYEEPALFKDDIVIYPTGKDSSEILIPERIPAEDEQVLVDDERITYVILGQNMSTEWTYEVNVYLENRSDKSLYIEMTDTAVNGTPMSPYWMMQIPAGMRVYSSFSFNPDNFDIAGIKEIEQIDFKLEVYEDTEVLDEPDQVYELTYLP